MLMPLGRRIPSNWEHVDKYPLTAPRLDEITTPRPLVIGVNWYSNFDNPVKDADGHWWIGRGPLGRVRGGHCVSLKQRAKGRRPIGSYEFYDQGSEGACVGFGVSQMMGQFNNKFYFARWLWDRAKEVDEWSDTNPGDGNGTSVRAALDIIRTRGHIVYEADQHDSMNRDGVSDDWRARSTLTPALDEGIRANRWITSIDDGMAVLGYGDVDYVDVMNSWGSYYPILTRMPATTLERLWREDGEIGVPTDR